MKTWEEYKDHVKNIDSQSYKDIKEIEDIVKQGDYNELFKNKEI